MSKARKEYEAMTAEERSAAILEEIKGVTKDVKDVLLGTTGFVVGTSLKAAGLGARLLRKTLHGIATVPVIKNNATKINNVVSNFVNEGADADDSTYTEEEIKRAEAYVKEMRKNTATK